MPDVEQLENDALPPLDSVMPEIRGLLEFGRRHQANPGVNYVLRVTHDMLCAQRTMTDARVALLETSMACMMALHGTSGDDFNVTPSLDRPSSPGGAQ